jgi:hypothetical protein
MWSDQMTHASKYNLRIVKPGPFYGSIDIPVLCDIYLVYHIVKWVLESWIWKTW